MTSVETLPISKFTTGVNKFKAAVAAALYLRTCKRTVSLTTFAGYPLETFMASKLKGNALSNYNVDYVISYRFVDTSMSDLSSISCYQPYIRLTELLGKLPAARQFQKLIQALAQLGFTIEVRNGDNCSLLVFVKAEADKKFNNEVYRSRCATNYSSVLRDPTLIFN